MARPPLLPSAALGDVLISFESEVNNIRKQYEAQGFEVVIPKTNILAEFPVAWVDKKRAGQRYGKKPPKPI